MKFLDDERLYSCTEDCLRFLLKLDRGFDEGTPRTHERYHLYWYGTFSLKQAFTVKSFLATQDLERSELWLWLDSEHGYVGYKVERVIIEVSQRPASWHKEHSIKTRKIAEERYSEEAFIKRWRDILSEILNSARAENNAL